MTVDARLVILLSVQFDSQFQMRGRVQALQVRVMYSIEGEFISLSFTVKGGSLFMSSDSLTSLDTHRKRVG